MAKKNKEKKKEKKKKKDPNYLARIDISLNYLDLIKLNISIG